MKRKALPTKHVNPDSTFLIWSKCMKRCLTVSTDGVTESGDDCLVQWQHDDPSWVWLDLHDEDAESEAELLQQVFTIMEHDLEEARRPRHPPSLHLNPDYAYILAKPLDSASHDLDFSTLQLAVFVGEHFVITRRSQHSKYIDKLWQMMLSGEAGIENPAGIVTALLRRTTDRYAEVLLNLEGRLDDIEDELMEANTDALLKELVSYNTSLRKMRRIITYHRHIFDRLQQQISAAKYLQDVKYEITDIAELMLRNSTLAELYQNVIDDLIEGYISLNGHRLNQIMKVLTVVTVIFVPITFLAGIYGMNFDNIPELKSANGYFILLSIMGVIVISLLAAFRRMKWL
mgnify:FL=1